MKIGVCSYCKIEKKINGKGYCNWCYRRYKWKPKKKICKRCGRLMFIKARGLCGGCYNTTYMLEYTKAWNHKKNYGLDLETYKKITSKCLICGFDKYVVLHHLDGNHKNNSHDNLVGLCPNHHQLSHTLKYKDEIKKQIDDILAKK